MLTSEQCELLGKLQNAQVPKFLELNPLSLSEDEADEFFKQNLPDLTYMDAVAVKKDENGEHIQARFIGVSENDALSQLRRWQDANGYDQLMNQPNPQFGFGMMWLDYFRQPTSQVSIPALVRHFSDWKDTVGVLPGVKVPKDQQKQIGVKASIPGHKTYQRLSDKEAGQILSGLRAGDPLPAGLQVGHSVGIDDRVYTVDKSGREKVDHFVSLKDLTEDEWDILLTGDTRDELSAEAQSAWEKRGRGEVSSEAEQELVEKGYLLDDADLSFSERMIPAKKLDNIFVQRETGMTEDQPERPVMEGSYSPLELAFDDCPEDRMNIFEEYLQKRQERELFAVTDEMRAEIRAYQAEGKAPQMSKDAYKALTRADALAYLETYKDTPADTYERKTYEFEKEIENPKAPEAFPQYKRVNLLSARGADYLQRSVLRDLAKEGHICPEQNVREFLDKIPLMTDEQASALMEGHMGEAPGKGLIAQTNGFIAAGKLVVRSELKTVGDCVKIFHANKNLDSFQKAALQDLAEAGIIDVREPDKLVYTPQHFDNQL